MRNISPDIFLDDFIGTQSLRLRLLWMGLILSLADDQGRLLDKPLTIKMAVFPFDAKIKVEDIEADLKILARAHKIMRYRAGNNGDGKALIQIIKWWSYQNKTAWAQRSIFPAPPKWVDRIRISEGGRGSPIIMMNWELEGGFIKKSFQRFPVMKDAKQDAKQDAMKDAWKIKDKELKNKEKKEQVPTTPPTPLPDEDGKDLDGGLAGALKKLKPAQREEIKKIKKVLELSSLGQPRLNSLLVILATRRLKEENMIELTLAALASAFDDDRAKNKAIIAAHRIENDQVPPQYFKARNWKSIPENILKAAGINNLASYVSEAKIKAFVGR